MKTGKRIDNAWMMVAAVFGFTVTTHYAVEKFDAPPPPPTEPVYISDWTSNRLSATQGWGDLGVDTAVKPPGNAAPLKLSIGGREYAHGLGAHANGTITLQLDGKYETLEAEIGVQTQLNHIGSVVFCVLGDGEELFRSDVMKGGQQARKIRVSGALRMRCMAVSLSEKGNAVARGVRRRRRQAIGKTHYWFFRKA